MLKINNDTLQADTRTLTATLERGVITSLTRKSDGKPLIKATAQDRPPLHLIYARQEAVPLGLESGDRVTLLPINDYCAEFRVESWHGDGVIVVSEDRETGDLIVEPSGYASRPGLRACRWSLYGIADRLDLVAPFFQGARLPLKDALIHNTHWMWPHYWEAQLAILQGRDGGLWVHSQDDRYRFKALHVGSPDDARCLGFDTECYGPVDDSLGAGGVAWRINVHTGDWQVPAAQFRDWLARAYRPERTPRPEWIKDVRFAVSWCPCETDILTALAQRLDPRAVLLHIPGWRTDGYDQNYPTFVASKQGRAFIKQAQKMGFRIMPHFNAIDMDPTHPAYASLRDFQFRDIESHRVQGWTWDNGKILPVQESNAARLRHQDKNTMVKIHPGLGMWRSLLAENVRKAAESLRLDAAFLDVTLCSWNLHNALVENMTASEGMQRLIARVASLGNGLVIGGEGRNESTFQDQGLAQVHLFKSWQTSIAGLERVGDTPVNEFLFGPWCRSFGYSALSGKMPAEVTRMRKHVSLGAMPTITVGSAAEIEQPNPAVEEMFSETSRV